MATTKRAPRAKTATAGKKTLPAHQAHGALPPAVNMAEMFGLKSAYTAANIDQYRKQLSSYTITDLHAHAHNVGVIPMDPKEKLISALEKKFVETKSKEQPMRVLPTNVNPGGQEFIKRFMAGELT
jgi:hypothetical protein